jgi:hypothetical protein
MPDYGHAVSGEEYGASGYRRWARVPGYPLSKIMADTGGGRERVPVPGYVGGSIPITDQDVYGIPVAGAQGVGLGERWQPVVTRRVVLTLVPKS